MRTGLSEIFGINMFSAREPASSSTPDGREPASRVQMAEILLAEDDDAMRQFLSTALTRAGHRVVSHSDGRKALAALDRPYDLLIADIVMPGLDGIELARRARAASPS